MTDKKENGSGLVVSGNRGMRLRPTNLVERGLDHIARTKPSEQTKEPRKRGLHKGVLVEALSVIVRRDAVAERFPGGWRGFLRHVPNHTLCIDNDLARVGFMNPADVEAYTSTLEAEGLVFQEVGQAVDFAVVDQLTGPTVPAPWLEYGQIETGGMKISACWLAGQSPEEVAHPDGWKYEGSSSDKPLFVAGDTMDDRFKFLRRENSLDVYLDQQTGKEVYAGRPAIAGDREPALFTRLEALSHEVLDIDARMQPLLTLKDEQGLAPLFTRLNKELLPAVVQIAEGDGQEMSFAHFTLGLILRILHRREEAEGEFRKANELQPKVINTLRELVRCMGEQDKHEEALPFAREAVEVAPTDARAWGNLAMCLIQCGQREEAHGAIDYAIQLDPQDQINCYIRDHFESYFQKS